MADHLDPLRLASRQRRRWPSQTEVSEPDRDERTEVVDDAPDDGLGGRMIDGRDDRGEVGDLHRRALGDGVAGDADRTGEFVEPLPTAIRADLRHRAPSNDRLLALGRLPADLDVDTREPLEQALVVLRATTPEPGGRLAARDECITFGLRPIPQRCRGFEDPDVCVLPVPVLARCRSQAAGCRRLRATGTGRGTYWDRE